VINKILFTIFAVIAIWKAFSMLSKLTKSNGTTPTRTPPPGAGSQQGSSKAASAPESIDLVPCPRCGSYVDPKEGCRCTTSAS
jgi:hypothetical protein